MTIHELISKIPAEKIQVQYLQEGDVEAKVTKHGTRITFWTGSITPTEILNGTGRICLMLWIPKELFPTE